MNTKNRKEKARAGLAFLAVCICAWLAIQASSALGSAEDLPAAGDAQANAPESNRSAPARPEDKIIAIDPPEKDFFSKLLDYDGIPIKAHKDVADAALFAAKDRLSKMLGKVPAVRARLRRAKVELHIIGRNQVTSDLPEWKRMKDKPFDGNLTIDQRTRGMGGRLVSCGEENLLRLERDRYKGRDICVHEFSHAIYQFGFTDEFRKRWNEQYERSLAKGLWKNSYAASNPDEFFAELSMWFFGTHGDLHMNGPKPEVGPEGLKKYDPQAFALLEEFYSGKMEDPNAQNGRRKNETQPGAASLPARAFPLPDVKLLDSPFRRARNADAAYLLKLEPDRLLSRFREFAGLKPKADIYGGWEAETLSGHSLGHYLSACALMYAATGDERFKDRIAYIINDLEACQNAHGDGYVSAIPNGRKLFQQVAQGDIRAQAFDLNGGWSPFYTLHKLFAGLRDCWRYCGFRRALDIEVKLADWVWQTLAGLNDDQMQEVLKCEHGGMNEVLADLYADTGESRWLALARRFHHKAVLDPLARGEDRLANLHGNTQIPKLIGLARLYQLTGDPQDLKAAQNFWDFVANHHSYVTGGNSEGEYFGPPDQLADRLTDKTTETCNTYNMLKLTRLLFEVAPRVEYADFYERALYNHILGSQDPADGMVTYFVPLCGGCAKQYTTPFDTFTCCLGTGMENHAKYQDSIYFHGRDALYVNLFIPSELSWKEKGLMLRQETNFPDGDKVNLTFRCDQPVELSLRIRCPNWARPGLRFALSGQELDIPAKPGEYAEIRRLWRSGDDLEIRIPMGLRLEAMPDNANRVAIFHGPILLAGELGPEDDPAANDYDYVPVLMTDAKSLLKQIEPLEGRPGEFRTVSIGRPRDVTLLPFFRLHHKRYAIYWDLVTPRQWAERQAAGQADKRQRREIEALTVDAVKPGNEESEKAHNMKGDKLEADEFINRPYRLSRGGWFSYELKVLPDQPMALACTYWGGERSGTRAFELLVDDEVIAAQTLENNKPGQFFQAAYPIPPKLTEGKRAVQVKFRAQPNKWAGAVYDVRTIRRSNTSQENSG